jgi:hypothetical protein
MSGSMPALARPTRPSEPRRACKHNAEAEDASQPAEDVRAKLARGWRRRTPGPPFDEINAGGLQGTTNREAIGSCKRNPLLRNLSAADCIHAQSCLPSEILGVMSASSPGGRMQVPDQKDFGSTAAIFSTAAGVTTGRI